MNSSKLQLCNNELVSDALCSELAQPSAARSNNGEQFCAKLSESSPITHLRCRYAAYYQQAVLVGMLRKERTYQGKYSYPTRPTHIADSHVVIT
eukprot:6214760-Pleurochrysis_carterae.AAC.2